MPARNVDHIRNSRFHLDVLVQDEIQVAVEVKLAPPDYPRFLVIQLLPFGERQQCLYWTAESRDDVVKLFWDYARPNGMKSTAGIPWFLARWNESICGEVIDTETKLEDLLEAHLKLAFVRGERTVELDLDQILNRPAKVPQEA